MSTQPSPPGARPIPAYVALIPVLSLIALLMGTLVVLPKYVSGFEGSGHLPLLFSAAIAGLVAWRYGHPYKELEDGMTEGIRMALGAVLILCVIGMLMGTWLAGGVVPALIYWGMLLLDPSYFLPTACAVCSIVSLVSGSSWSTAGTVGLALVGIGEAMGVPPGMTAGAVVSGAYFGDKLSPMSDTTNLAPAMAGADLFSHIRHMVFTTGPAWGLAMLGYIWLGLGLEPNVPPESSAAITDVIRSSFHPSIVHLTPPLAILTLVTLRKPALPTLLLGAMLGGVLAMLVENASWADVLSVMMSGYKSATGSKAVDELLSRGGLMSMANTVFLVLCAMSFGGIMERTGMLRTLADQVLRLARSTGSLIATTVLTATGINIVAADQYIAIVVPGRMFTEAYRRQGLDPKNLSRAIEDGGTITSALVPWNSCGAFMAGALTVSTLTYLPYAFVNLLNPLISIVLGYTGWTIERLPPESPPTDVSSSAA